MLNRKNKHLDTPLQIPRAFLIGISNSLCRRHSGD